MESLICGTPAPISAVEQRLALLEERQSFSEALLSRNQRPRELVADVARPETPQIEAEG